MAMRIPPTCHNDTIDLFASLDAPSRFFCRPRPGAEPQRVALSQLSRSSQLSPPFCLPKNIFFVPLGQSVPGAYLLSQLPEILGQLKYPENMS
jgi:hypothetical protein